MTDALAPGLREVGMVTSALWTDVDGDGWPDLLLALEWGNVRYFHNNQGKGFEDWTERAGFASAGTGWWTSIAAADFNGDGRIDYVVGNVGLNTHLPRRSRASRAALLRRLQGRGPERSSSRPTTRATRSTPGAAAGTSAPRIPSILKRFPTYDSYARATLGEIVGEDRLAKARRFAATELRSGVFLSQPDGTYRFEPLPRIAQIAPLQGMVAGDFGGDGHADIYAVQNSYAPITSVGRFDGGLSQLLRGDGHGHFAAVPPARERPRRARRRQGARGARPRPGRLARLPRHAEQRHDARVPQQGRRRPQAAAHRPARGRREPDGRRRADHGRALPTARPQTSEVYAGSGYYSQSTAACFFGYPEANPPRRIRVRWPSGASSEHAFPAGSTSLTLSAPPPAGQP